MTATAWIQDLPFLAAARERFGAQAPRLAALLLLALIAVQVAVTITRQATAVPAAAGASMATPRPVPAREVDLTAIVNAHLFGQKTAASMAPGDAPPTTIPLVLAGVYAVADPAKGMAIIGQSATDARLVQVGGNLAGGVKLNSVYYDRVLIDRGGSLEAVYLPKTLTGRPPLVVAPPTNGGQRLQAMSQNGTLLNGLLRVQAVTAQGKLTGFRVFPAGANSNNVFGQLGLRAGDLITHINGTALDDMNRSAEILQTLSNASSASVTVTRNGQPVEVNLNFTAVADAAEQAVAADSAAQTSAASAAAAAGNRGAFGAAPGAGGPNGGPNARFNGRNRGTNNQGNGN